MDPITKKSILFITEKVIEKYAKIHQKEILNVMKDFLASKTFIKLNKEESLMWSQGVVASYKQFEKEMSSK